MTVQSTLSRLFVVTTVTLVIGCTTAQKQIHAQEGNAMLPKFFDGMTLLEENDCPSFTVKYYATPEVTLAELKNPRVEKGHGFVVVPKEGVYLTEVSQSSSAPFILSETYFVTYQPSGERSRDITENQLDGHIASPDSAMVPSALFKEGGVFSSGGSYGDTLGNLTNGTYGKGTITIDNRAADIFRGSDGSSCTIQPPKVRFQIK